MIILWLLLKGLGYPASTLSYNCEVEEDIPKPLDPVENAGILRSAVLDRKAKILKWNTAVAALRFTNDAHHFKTLLDPTAFRTPRHLRMTKAKYAEHIRCLVLWGILEEVPPEMLRHVSTYFSVPKSLLISRAIFNGSDLSRKCSVPPPTGLLDASRINRILSRIVSRGRVYGFFGDWRHFFHCCRLAEEIQNYFGICCQGVCYRWRTLPMGWSHSPHIAQTIGWILLCGRSGNQTPLVNEDFADDECLPHFLEIVKDKTTVGYIFLYYDNFLVVSSCAVTTQRVRHRLEENMAEATNGQGAKMLKELTTFNDKQLQQGALHYLGCDYTIRVIRTREGIEQRALRWRLKKTPTDEDWSTLVSCRTMAQRLGKASHRMVIEGGKPRSWWWPVLKIIRAVAKFARKNGWESKYPSTNEERDNLEATRRYLVENSWIEESGDPQQPVNRIVVVCDASKTGFGWFIIKDGCIVEVQSHTWHSDMSQLHIYKLEAYAATAALKRALSMFGISKYMLVTDNSAVAGMLARRFSILDDVQRWLESCGLEDHDLEVRLIASEDNIADDLSRGKQTVGNVPALLRLVEQYEAGRIPRSQRKEKDERASMLIEEALEEESASEEEVDA